MTLSQKKREEYLEIARALDSARYKFYTPHGGVEEIIRELGNAYQTGKRIFMASAANGWTKTTAEINILINLCYDEINDKWFNYPIYKQNFKYPKNIYVITEDSTLREVWDSDSLGIHFWFPEGRYKTFKDDKGRLSRLVTDTGWNIHFKTVDQNPRKFESITLGLVIYDEPVSQAIHNSCVARLRGGGFIFCGATPLDYAEWMIDVWLENEEMKPYLYVRYGSVYENMRRSDWEVHKEDILKQAREHGMGNLNPIRGRLTYDAIQFMISQYDDEEIEARVWGKFKALRGNVYKSYKDEEPYVIEPFSVSNPHDYQIYCVIDPHDRRYPAIGWFAIDRANRKYIVNEYPNVDRFQGKYYYQIGDSNLDIEQISNIIKEIEKQNGYHMVGRVIDPNFGNKRYGNTGNTVQEEFEIHDLYFENDVVDDLNIGHSKVRELLKIGNLGVPGIQIFKTCHNHRWAFRRYRYDDQKKGVGADKVLQSEKVIEKAKDFADTVRYFAVMDYKFSATKAVIKGWRSKLRKKQTAGSWMGA